MMSECPPYEAVLGFHGISPYSRSECRVSGVLGRAWIFKATTMVQTHGSKCRGWVAALRLLLPQAPMLFSFKLSTLVIFNIL